MINSKYFNLVDALNKHLTRDRFVKGHRSTNFYPTEASAEYRDLSQASERTVIVGKCIRAAFYRCSGMFEDAKVETTPRREIIFSMGKLLEMGVVEYFKQMGLWIDNNIKIFDTDRKISGEIDVFIRDPRTNSIIGVEIKTYYGYSAEKQIEGNYHNKGAPKIEHVLQAALYLDHVQNSLKLPVRQFKILYINRGTGHMSEFNLTLEVREGQVYVAINDEIMGDFPMASVYQRYSLLAQYLASKEIPPPDYMLHYPPNLIEEKRMKGDISDSAYKNYKRNPNKYPIGDWQCGYCDFKKVCWGTV